MVWWEKVMEVAVQFANQNNLKILEQTAAGKLLSSLQSVANTVLGKERAYKMLLPLWDKGFFAISGG